MRSVEDIPRLENIPVIVRAALNVPIENGKVANAFRLHSALPTIEFLRKKRARVVLIGHIGEKGTETLEPVYEAMKTLLPGLKWCPATTGPQAREAVRALAPGGVVMLENVRRNAGEVKNDMKFAQQLAELADVYVEDSFDVCHREHASVMSLPKLLAPYAGLQVIREVTELTKALTPARPALAIIGGAKFATKEPVLTSLLKSYDRVFVGGALANDFMRISGKTIGKSLVSSGVNELEIRKLLNNPKLMLPLDEVAAPLGATHNEGKVYGVNDIPKTHGIYDDGPKTVSALASAIANAKTVLWNGPLGLYEKGFTDSTQALARAIGQSEAYSILGGGDTVAAVEELGLARHFSFISTGGGAMLDFLAKGTLPGLAVLNV